MTAPQPTEDGGSLGRDIRLFTGVFLILLDGALLVVDAVAHEPVTTPDIILHIALLAAGLLLIDPVRFLELVNAVKDKLPLIGGK